MPSLAWKFKYLKNLNMNKKKNNFEKWGNLAWKIQMRQFCRQKLKSKKSNFTHFGGNIQMFEKISIWTSKKYFWKMRHFLAWKIQKSKLRKLQIFGGKIQIFEKKISIWTRKFFFEIKIISSIQRHFWRENSNIWKTSKWTRK